MPETQTYQLSNGETVRGSLGRWSEDHGDGPTPITLGIMCDDGRFIPLEDALSLVLPEHGVWGEDALRAESGSAYLPTDPALAHLRDDAPSVVCSGCGRHSWGGSAAGTSCEMPQPDGSRCSGVFGLPVDPSSRKQER